MRAPSRGAGLDYGSARPLAQFTWDRRSNRSPCLHPVVFREPRPTNLGSFLCFLRLFAAISSSVLTFAHFASLREIFFGAVSDL